MLALSLLVALLIWPSWWRLWAFVALIACFSVVSTLAFGNLDPNVSEASGVRAALSEYLAPYERVFQTPLNLAEFVSIGALIVWLRRGAKAPKFLHGSFKFWVFCIVVAIVVGAWGTAT